MLIFTIHAQAVGFLNLASSHFSLFCPPAGQDACNVGDEGGFAPNISSNDEGLNLVNEAIEKAGYTGKVNGQSGGADACYVWWWNAPAWEGLGWPCTCVLAYVAMCSGSG